MNSLSEIERFGFVADDIKAFLAKYEIHISGEREPETQPAPTPIAEKSLGTTERNQLLKMVLGMAIDSYGYDPMAKKNEATKQIVDDLAKLGIGIDADTVRKYLKEAANTVTYEMPKP